VTTVKHGAQSSRYGDVPHTIGFNDLLHSRDPGSG